MDFYLVILWSQWLPSPGRRQPSTHGSNRETMIEPLATPCRKQERARGKPAPGKHKYEPNLMTFQNKEHYRKKASLWEVLLIDNYRFSIHFLSHTHTRILKSDIAVFVFVMSNSCLCQHKHRQQPHHLEHQWVQKCAVQFELFWGSAWAEPGWELLLPFQTALPSTKCQTMEFVHVVSALLRQPHQWVQF